MALEAIAAVSSLSRNAAVSIASRPPEVTPDAREAALQENDARRIAESVRGASPAYLSGPNGPVSADAVGTRVNVVPVPSDPEGSLQLANAQIARAYGSGEPTAADMRAASEAYRAEAVSRDDLARQRQGEGSRALDVLA